MIKDIDVKMIKDMNSKMTKNPDAKTKKAKNYPNDLPPDLENDNWIASKPAWFENRTNDFILEKIEQTKEAKKEELKKLSTDEFIQHVEVDEPTHKLIIPKSVSPEIAYASSSIMDEQEVGTQYPPEKNYAFSSIMDEQEVGTQYPPEKNYAFSGDMSEKEMMELVEEVIETCKQPKNNKQNKQTIKKLVSNKPEVELSKPEDEPILFKTSNKPKQKNTTHKLIINTREELLAHGAVVQNIAYKEDKPIITAILKRYNEYYSISMQLGFCYLFYNDSLSTDAKNKGIDKISFYINPSGLFLPAAVQTFDIDMCFYLQPNLSTEYNCVQFNIFDLNTFSFSLAKSTTDNRKTIVGNLRKLYFIQVMAIIESLIFSEEFDAIYDVKTESGILQKSTTKVEIIDNFMFRGKNLKGETGIIIQAGIKDIHAKHTYAYIDLEKDIGGSSNDGRLRRKSCLFIPTNVIKKIEK